MNDVRRIVTAAGGEVRESANPDDLWAIRRYMSPAVGRLRPNKINEDIVVPRSRVADYLAAMDRLQPGQFLLIQRQCGRLDDLSLRLSRQHKFGLHQVDGRKTLCGRRIKANGAANFGIPEFRMIGSGTP